MDFTYLPFSPPAALTPYLRATFFARGTIPYTSDKILPNGLAVLVVNKGAPHRLGKSDEPARNSAYAHSWFHGVQTTPVYNTPGGETHVLGFLFEPVGVRALFGLDMDAYVDKTVDGRSALPDDFMAVVEEVLPFAHEPRAHDRLFEALGGRAAVPPPAWLMELYGAVKRETGATKLADAYAAIGMSARHINAQFKKAVGVSAKTLSRIYRLNALLEEIDPAQPVNWAALAHECEFYDQAHFNREFRAFAGLYPSQYLEQRRREYPGVAKGENVSFAPQR